MNSRQGALLRALLDAGDYKTSADFGRELGCSDRTVRSDVKALNAPAPAPTASSTSTPCA